MDIHTTPSRNYSMRILLLIPSMKSFGGTERVVSNLARLLSTDHEVHVASFDSESVNPCYEIGTPFHPLGEPAKLSLPLRPLTYAQQARRLAALKRRAADFAPDKAADNYLRLLFPRV